MERIASNDKNIRFVDLYRLLAMLLVMWGHFVGVGMYAYEIPGVIAGTMNATIIPSEGFWFAGFESFLYGKLHTQSAILGVIMFFVCTGYLLPRMMERYTRTEFAINRLLRIFPTLLVCTVLVGALVYFSQGITFDFWQWFSSVTLTYQFIRRGTVMGVLWTLTVEVVFYFLVMIYGKPDGRFIVGGYLLTLVCGVLYAEFSNAVLYDAFYNMRYVCFCLLGVTLYCAEKREGTSIQRYLPTLGAFCANLLIFRIARERFGDETTYPNFFSQMIPLLLFQLLLILDKWTPKGFARIPKFLYGMSKLVYPVFLTHVAVGLTVMYYCSQAGLNRYLTPLAGAAVAFAVGKLIQIIIEKPSARWANQAITVYRAKKTEEKNAV